MHETSLPGIYNFTSQDDACALSDIHRGTTVMVDTTFQPSNNDIVCVRYKDKLHLRRILFLDASYIYVPDDPHYAVIEADESALIGVITKII